MEFSFPEMKPSMVAGGPAVLQNTVVEAAFEPGPNLAAGPNLAMGPTFATGPSISNIRHIQIFKVFQKFIFPNAQMCHNVSNSKWHRCAFKPLQLLFIDVPAAIIYLIIRQWCFRLLLHFRFRLSLRLLAATHRSPTEG